jgi:hypothetical protein
MYEENLPIIMLQTSIFGSYEQVNRLFLKQLQDLPFFVHCLNTNDSLQIPHVFQHLSLL